MKNKIPFWEHHYRIIFYRRVRVMDKLVRSSDNSPVYNERMVSFRAVVNNKGRKIDIVQERRPGPGIVYARRVRKHMFREGTLFVTREIRAMK